MDQAAQHHPPVPLTDLIGRERELAQVGNLLAPCDPDAAHRLITLTGPGGIGKTRLAQEVVIRHAEDFADGIHFVPLTPLTDPETIPLAIARVLGLPEMAGQSIRETVIRSLVPRHSLLVLDNFEHLIAGSPLVLELLAVAPRLWLLVTSRESLRVTGEQEYPVLPLEVPESGGTIAIPALEQNPAVALFVERARAVKPDFAVTEGNAAAVIAVCQKLDGIPLAIELAAARVKMLPVEQIAQRLDNALSLLTAGTRSAQARHRSLQAALDWSYALLAPEECALFGRLAVFMGGFTLDAAESVCDDGSLGISVLELLANLVDKSLVVPVPNENDPGSSRFRLLEIVRQYAAATLRGEPGADEMCWRDRHLSYFVSLAEDAELGLRGERQVAWVAQLNRELPNLRRAFTWALEHGQPAAAARLSSAIWRFWWMRGYFSQGRRWLDLALEHPDAASIAPAVQVKALGTNAVLAHYQGDYAAAQRLAEESLALCGAYDDRADTLPALLVFGLVARATGDLAGAKTALAEAMSTAADLGDDWFLGLSAFHAATVEVQLGNYAVARGLLEHSLTLHKSLRDTQGIADALGYLGHVAFGQGDSAAAFARYGEALRYHRELHNPRGIAEMRLGLSTLNVLSSRYEEAQAGLYESLPLFCDLGDRWYVAVGLCALGVLSVAADQAQGAARATRLFGAVEALNESIGTTLPPLLQTLYHRQLALARDCLGPITYGTCWAEGRGMSLDSAVEYALHRVGAPVTPPVELAPAPGRLPTPLQTAKSQYAGLTAREREVAALVARGLSNHEIAERLVLSDRTVGAHVGHILAKLEFSSRSQIAAWAISRGLVQPLVERNELS